MTKISDELIVAYSSTNFYITPENICVKIDGSSRELSNFLIKNSVNSCAFISSHNPFSVNLSVSENYDRLFSLHELLKDKYSLVPYKSSNENYPKNTENGFLALGITLDEAKNIGIFYEQNAIVWFGEEKIARLILLR